MFSIGEFASIGRVSVRMLRHYDAIGLLIPAQVDAFTGYRSYAPEQLPTLARILELKDFGLRLEDISRIINGVVDRAEERRLLTHSRDQLAGEIVEASTRLRRLEAFLQPNQEGISMSSATAHVVLRGVEPQTVAFMTDRAAGFGNANIGPVVGPLFDRLASALSAAEVSNFGPGIAVYAADESGDGSGVLVTAAFVVSDSVMAEGEFEITNLPGIDEAAVMVHHGTIDGIEGSWLALEDWIRSNNYELSGVCREVYITPGIEPQEKWVTELVQPVRRA